MGSAQGLSFHHPLGLHVSKNIRVPTQPGEMLQALQLIPRRLAGKSPLGRLASGIKMGVSLSPTFAGLLAAAQESRDSRDNPFLPLPPPWRVAHLLVLFSPRSGEKPRGDEGQQELDSWTWALH